MLMGKNFFVLFPVKASRNAWSWNHIIRHNKEEANIMRRESVIVNDHIHVIIII